MPSEMVNLHGPSPSFFHEEAYFCDAGQAGVSKIDHMSGYYDLKGNGAFRTTGVVSSALEDKIPLDNQMKKGLDLTEYYLSHGLNVNLSLGKHFVGAENEASRSLPRAADHDLGARTNKMNKESASSYILNVKLPSSNGVYCQSVGDAAATNYEEEAFESLEELEAQTVGNLLPDDDDLFSGVIGGFDSAIRPNNAEDMEDFDLFSSIGGLELGEDGSSQKFVGLSDVNYNNQLRGDSTCGEHPLGQPPSRTLFVRNINSNIKDTDLQKLFEKFGDMHTLYTACKHRGFVMISYYDIRASCNAMKALQDRLLMRRKLDIHFSIPKENLSEKDINQGTIVVFNRDSSISNNKLSEIFGIYGDIKEIHETPQSSHQKIIEFYDVRAAESAIRALNRSDSKRLIQYMSSELEQEETGLRLLQLSPPNLTTGYSGSLSLGGTKPDADNGTIIGPRSVNRGLASPHLDNLLHFGVSSSVPNCLSSLVRADSGNRSSIAQSERLQYQLKFDLQETANLYPHSLPEYYDGLTNGTSYGSRSTISANISARLLEIHDNPLYNRIISNGQLRELNEVFGSNGYGSCPPPGQHYMWGNSHNQQPQSIVWPNSPSFVEGICAGHPQQLHAVHRPPSHVLSKLLPLNDHHVGSALSINPSVWDMQHAYAGQSPDSAVFHRGSLGNTSISVTSWHPLELLPPNAFPRTGRNSLDMPITSKSIGLHPDHQRCMIYPARGSGIPMISLFDSPDERIRNRIHESTTTQGYNRKQFELDVDRIMRGDDKRTTLMIKNIPNKYTSKMLLATIDESHKGTYDFVYLPIDFKNKCSVGYAFINMTDPSHIVPFYQTLNGKKWEKFNSEKVATLAYARIQGKAALIAHFQNSSLMNEDKRCRPIIFHKNGPNAGDQVPFPMSGKKRGSNQEMASFIVNKEDCSSGESSTGSGK